MGTHKHILWIAIPGALLVFGVMAFAIFEPLQVLPRYAHTAPGFFLTDHSSEKFTSEEARGDVVLYTFGYAGCGDRCLATEATMREVKSRLGEVDLGEGVDMRLVTLTIDPRNDTPEVLRAEAERVGADGETWLYATGEPGHVENVIRAGFRVWYEEQEDGSFALDPTFILVDGWGVVRGDYRYQTVASDADKIIRHLGLLGDEIRNSHGAASLAFGAAHLFLCFP